MMMVRAFGFLTTAFCVTLVGCASDEVAGENGATGDKVELGNDVAPADVTTEKIQLDTTACKVDLERPVVDAHDDGANAAIKRALANGTAQSYCPAVEPGDEDLTYDVEGGFTVTTNETGVLSLSIGSSDYTGGAAHPNNYQQTYTFDITTGALLQLSDVLSEKGVKTVLDSCVTTLSTPQEGESESFYDAEGAAQVCGSALTENAEISPLYTIDADGLHLSLNRDLPHALQALESFTTYAALEGAFKDGVVKNFVAKKTASTK